MKKIIKRLSAFILACALITGNCMAWGTEAHAGSKPNKITLNKQSHTMSVGDTLTLRVTSAQPSGASKKVTWHTSNSRIATVNAASGKVTAKKSGTATITAKSKTNPRVKATCKIKVKAKRKVLWSGTDRGLKWKLYQGGKLELSGRYTGKKACRLEHILTYDLTDRSGYRKYEDKIRSVVVTAKGFTNMRNFFSGFKKLESVDLSKCDTSKVTDMGWMFDGCPKLKSVNLKGINTGKVTNMRSMFLGCTNIKTIDLSGLNTKKVTDMGAMFHNCGNLKSVNLKGINTGKVKDMSSMFSFCRKLTKLDVSSFDTRNVKDMRAMFSSCEKLKSLDLRNFNTSKVTSMVSMFGECKALQNLNIDGFDTRDVTQMHQMFRNCSSLKSLRLPASFKGQYYKNGNYFTSVSNRAYSISDDVFRGCAVETLELGAIGWYGTNGIPEYGKFLSDCKNLKKLDLSHAVVEGKGNYFEQNGITLYCSSSLRSIMVPVNISKKVNLRELKANGGRGERALFKDAAGNTYDTLPLGVTETFEITR